MMYGSWLAVGLALAGDAADNAVVSDPMKIDAGPEGTTMHTLPNGLVVILQEDHRTDTVALHLRYGVGAHDEKAGEHGCAHLFEHLMFEGSANVGPNKFDELLTAAGGSNNAYTSDDVTAYHMVFPSGATDLGLFIESDRMGWLLPGVTQENLSNQQLVVLQERAEGYADPNGRDWDALQVTLYPESSPYHVPTIGTVADVEGFKIEGVHAFWTAHYRPRNAVLVLVGNFETEDMLTKVQTWFGEVPDPGPAAPRATWTAPAPRAVDAFIEDDVAERTLYVAWPTVPLNHADEPALDVLSYVLSAGRGTRLEDALYYDKPWTTGVGTYSYMMDAEGMFLLYASTPKKPLKAIAKTMSAVVADIGANPPTAAELDRAKRQLKADLLDPMEVLADRAEWLADCQAVRGRPDCLADQWARYEAVTSEDLVRVASTWLVPERRITLSVIPRGDDGQLGGTVPVELP